VSGWNTDQYRSRKLAWSVVASVGTSSGATNGVSKTFCSATTIDVTGILNAAKSVPAFGS
jgi:hypothetical protein